MKVLNSLKPDGKFAPRFFIDSDRVAFTRGDEIVNFAHNYLTPYRGKLRGKPMRLLAWQIWVLYVIFALDKNFNPLWNEFILGLPRKQGKSMITSLIAVFHVLTNHDDALVWIVAGDKNQAKPVFDGARKFILANPKLAKEFDIKRSTYTIIHKRTGGVIQIVAPDDNKTHGGHPSLVILDEAHVLGSSKQDPNFADSLWETLTSGSSDRDGDYMAIMITTAGEEKNTFFGSKFDLAVKHAENRFDEDDEYDDKLGMAWWGFVEGEDPFDEELWYRCIPNLSSGLTNLEYIRTAAKRARISKGRLPAFIRLQLNGWVRNNETTFVSETMWSKTLIDQETIPRGKVISKKTGKEIKRKVTLGFDGSMFRDTTAIVLCDVDTGFMEVLRSWRKEDPDDSEWFVPRQEVKDTLFEAFEMFNVVLTYADTTFYREEFQDLYKKYGFNHAIYEESQSYGVVKPKAHSFSAAMMSGDVCHGNDELMRKHFFNALKDDQGMYKKKDKNAIKYQIDILVAAVHAVAARQDYLLDMNGGGLRIKDVDTK